MHIFLAGGTGVLGRRIVPMLIDGGHTVTVLARHPERARGLADLGAVVLNGDVFERARTMRLIADAAPDVLMHQLTDLAAGSRAANAELRVTGTRNLVDGAVAAGVPRVIVQSIAWAYEGGDGPATETTPLDADSTDETRRATVDAVICMEEAVQQLPEWVILRNGLLYGPDTWYWSGGSMAEAAMAGALPESADVTSFVHVDDAATAAVAALHWPTGAVNVVDDEPASGRLWTPEFCKAVGAPVPSPAPGTERNPVARGAANALARDTLGWSPQWASWRAGFAAMQAG